MPAEDTSHDKDAFTPTESVPDGKGSNTDAEGNLDKDAPPVTRKPWTRIDP